MMMKNKLGLYVHIPFCNKICAYCAFSKVLYKEKIVDQYLDVLKEELKNYSSFKFASIYIGGGTPTSLSVNELKKLFEILKPYYEEDYYLTIEANPDLTLEKIKLLKAENVQRVSIGVQSFNSKYLKLINRDSDYHNIKKIIANLHEVGINNINLDLIYGFNDETIDELDKDINKLISLDIKHISTYCLQVEPGTLLYNQHYQEADDELAAKQYSYIVNKLEKNGFMRYEVSNFAKPGYESKHNLIYWNNQEYVGVGLGAASYLNHKRYSNTKSLTSYLNHEFIFYEEEVTKKDEEYYFIMLGLRKAKGFSLLEYKELFYKDFLLTYEDKLKLVKDSLLIEDDHVKIKKDQFFIMDFILRKILY